MIELLIVGMIFGILVITGLIVFVLVKKNKKRKQEPDYYTFFILGICFLPLGIIFSTTISPAFISFTGLGVIYITIGMSHKGKWKKKK